MALANQTKNTIKKVLLKKRLFYVCRDVERAEAGLYLGIKNFKIITNHSSWALELQTKYPEQIYLFKKDKILDTADLLKLPETKKIIKMNDLVVVFKPTVRVEAVAHENKWNLINPPAQLSNQIEEKMSQLDWLQDLKKLLPETKLTLVKDISYKGRKFIIQFNHAHTGSGTYLIKNSKDLSELQEKFPEREARVVKYIDGPIFTRNIAVVGKKIISGNLSYQITGLAQFTDREFATIGNDWSLPNILLSAKNKAEINKICNLIGKKMVQSGWRGLFGLDLVLDKKTERVYLIEINARQPASTSCESYLQKQSRQNGATIFSLHLIGLLGLSTNEKNTIVKDGAQIVQRVTEKISEVPEPLTLEKMPWRQIRYSNKKIGSDLLRLQSEHGMMKSHNELNEHGNELSIYVQMAIQRKYFGLPRAGMVIIKKDKILLIKRKRNDYEYFTMPGGTLETGEDELATAKREILEETGLLCEVNNDIKPIKFRERKSETYFFAKACKGKLALGGPEKDRNRKANLYTLKWVLIRELNKINLLPPILKETLVKRLSS